MKQSQVATRQTKRNGVESAWRAAIACLLLLPVATFAPAQSYVAAPTTDAEAGRVHVVGKYPAAKAGFTATALADGRVFLYGTNSLFLAGSLTARLDKLRQSRGSTSAGPYYQGPLLWRGQTGGWKKIEPPPQCPNTHNLATATALADGNVLIVGGVCDEARLADDLRPQEAYRSLSIWDAATGKWLDTSAALAQARIHHTATLLQDGSVLIVGGQTAPESRQGSPSPSEEVVLASVERVADGKVGDAASMSTPRAGHTATLLGDGHLLVVGGYDARLSPLDSAELYDPATRQWQSLPPLKLGRHGHSATLLDDGRVLVVGGQNRLGEPVSATEIWNPQADRWEAGAPLLAPVVAHSALRLANGDVLVAGGLTLGFEPARKAMLWNHQTGQWLPAGFRDTALWSRAGPPTLPLLPGAGGSALAFGDNLILQWLPRAPAPTPYPPYGVRTAHTATLLADGRILLAGGRNGNVFHDWAEVFDPATRQFSLSARMNQPRANHSAVRLDDGRVVVAGGWVRAPESVNEPADNSPEVWNPATNTWTLLGDIRFAWQDRVHLGRLANGRVLFFASRELSSAAPDKPVEYRAWLWEPRTNAVTALAVPLTPRAAAGIAILPDGRLLAVGGERRHFVDGQLESSSWPDAELWDIGRESVRTFAAPPQWYAPNPKTLVLGNGNVLLTNLEPINPYFADRKAAPVHLLDTKSMLWRRLPDIPEHLSWPTARW